METLFHQKIGTVQSNTAIATVTLHSHVKYIKECLQNISRGWLEKSFKKCLYRKLYLIQRIIVFAVSFHEADHIE